MVRVTRTLNPLHLEDLEPHRFEDLVRQLLYDLRRWRRLEATGRSGGDDGFDARGWEAVGTEIEEDVSDGEDRDQLLIETQTDDRLWLIQCKREKRIGPTQIEKYVADISDEEIKNVHGVLFAAACDFSKKTRDAFRSACAARGVEEWHLWGKAEIEDRLYQPVNDHLLFAYFGFSLHIRRRSLKALLASRLAVKRRVSKLPTFDAILIRDATDDRYPYLDEGAHEDRVARGRWVVRRIDGLDHDAVRIVLYRHFAVLEDDGSWDYAELMDDAKPGRYTDPWCDERGNEPRHERRTEAMRIWDSLPEHKKAWFEVVARIPFDDILGIDPDGDETFQHPHIYTTEWATDQGPFKGMFGRLQTTGFDIRTRYTNADEEGRISVFARGEKRD